MKLSLAAGYGGNLDDKCLVMESNRCAHHWASSGCTAGPEHRPRNSDAGMGRTPGHEAQPCSTPQL